MLPHDYTNPTWAQYHWRRFKRGRACTILRSVHESPLGTSLYTIAAVAAALYTVYLWWYVNYTLVLSGRLGVFDGALGDADEKKVSSAGVWCVIEAMVACCATLAGLTTWGVATGTINKVRADIGKYDVEAAMYVRKRDN